jgi:hypothetical protein
MVDANELWTLVEYRAWLAGQERREGWQNAPSVPQEQQRPLESSPRPPETEHAFMGRLLRLAKEYGWTCYHSYRSTKSAPGFPDLVLVRECVIFAELKTMTGKLTPEQATWLSLLQHAGQEAYVWKPQDWARIQARLTAKVAQHDDEEERPQC